MSLPDCFVVLFAVDGAIVALGQIGWVHNFKRQFCANAFQEAQYRDGMSLEIGG